MKVSIVIPVYCEQKNIPFLYDRLESVTKNIPNIKWKYVFVNDGSTDNTMAVLRELTRCSEKVEVISFARNFGKEVALSAGVNLSDGDAVICMDADLQHPPELIPDLIDAWLKGAEIVATIRVRIDKQPILRRVGSHVYYWLMSRVSGLDMVSQTTDFRLLDNKVVEVFRRVTERERLFRGIIDWMGFKKVYVEFHAGARENDNPSFSYLKLWHIAISSITAFSLWPLRITGYLGLLVTGTSGLLIMWMLGHYFYNTIIFTPLAMVVVVNTFLIGIVLMAIGLVALYIGAIHTEVINRPLYIVSEHLNPDDKKNDSKKKHLYFEQSLPPQ
jgi:dolichol-phosphate mannosyltransferase